MYKFEALPNPFGTVYNPISIHHQLGLALKNETAREGSYVRHQELWHHLDFHSAFSHPERAIVVASLRAAIEKTYAFLKTAQWIVITYGTAKVYETVTSGSLVANCHKLPAQQFRHRLLSPEEIIGSFNQLHDLVHKQNPNARFLLTVSPVRHIRDTIEINQVSKSILRYACHQITGQFANAHYFPSYEIMMDDLRDYRFYEADLIHPNEQAISYIWEKLKDSWFDDETRSFCQQWQSILPALQHKSFHPGTNVHQQFLRDTINKLQEFKNIVDVKKEIRQIESQLI